MNEKILSIVDQWGLNRMMEKKKFKKRREKEITSENIRTKYPEFDRD